MTEKTQHVFLSLSLPLLHHRYANTYGSWGWKSPPLSLVMYDNWGNRLQVEVYVTLNLKTWEVWNTKITNVQFLGGGGWGTGKK